MNKKITFSEYYKHYLSLHQTTACRRLHIAGQIVTLMLLSYIIFTQYWLLLFLVPFVVYPFAWFGHLYYEKNRPAAWTRPLWAKACDWIMFKDWILGKVKR